MVHYKKTEEPIPVYLDYEVKKGWFSKERKQETVLAHATEYPDIGIFMRHLAKHIANIFEFRADKYSVLDAISDIAATVSSPPIGGHGEGKHPVTEDKNSAKKYAIALGLALLAAGIKFHKYAISAYKKYKKEARERKDWYLNPYGKALAKSVAKALEEFKKEDIKVIKYSDYVKGSLPKSPDKVYDGFIIPPPEEIFENDENLDKFAEALDNALRTGQISLHNKKKMKELLRKSWEIAKKLQKYGDKELFINPDAKKAFNYIPEIQEYIQFVEKFSGLKRKVEYISPTKTVVRTPTHKIEIVHQGGDANRAQPVGRTSIRTLTPEAKAEVVDVKALRDELKILKKEIQTVQAENKKLREDVEGLRKKLDELTMIVLRNIAREQ